MKNTFKGTIVNYKENVNKAKDSLIMFKLTSKNECFDKMFKNTYENDRFYKFQKEKRRQEKADKQKLLEQERDGLIDDLMRHRIRSIYSLHRDTSYFPDENYPQQDQMEKCVEIYSNLIRLTIEIQPEIEIEIVVDSGILDDFFNKNHKEEIEEAIQYGKQRVCGKEIQNLLDERWNSSKNYPWPEPDPDTGYNGRSEM